MPLTVSDCRGGGYPLETLCLAPPGGARHSIRGDIPCSWPELHSDGRPSTEGAIVAVMTEPLLAAVVTGAASGMGAAVAERFVTEGWRVLALDADPGRLARIEAHYFRHHLFPPERDLVGRVGRLRRIPATIVQGRYDMVCPIRSADELARAWPEAEYIIVRDAGHSAMEPGIREQLVLAAERAKRW